MALTLTHIEDDHDAIHAAERTGTLRALAVWDNSYPTGGEALTTAMINAALVAGGRHAGCTASAIVQVTPGLPTDNSIHVTWDSGNAKLVAYVTATEAEVGNGVDLSAVGFKTQILIRYTKGA